MMNPWAVAIAVGAGLGALLYVMLFQNPVRENEEPHQNHERRRRRDPLDLCASYPEAVCSICLTEIESDCLRLECGHRFHFKCMEENVKHGNNFCPNCRQRTDFRV